MLELFNAIQPSPSLVQVRQSTAAVARRATDPQDAQDVGVESEVNLLSKHSGEKKVEFLKGHCNDR